MPDGKTCTILAAGLPSSGKTTFLAAFYAVLESNEVQTRLRLEKSGDDDSHLNKIRSEWTQCLPVPRNDPGTKEIVPLSIQGVHSDDHVQLVFPDLNGETFRDQWLNRTAEGDHRQLTQNASAILLFVNPDKIDEPWQIRDAQRIEAALDVEADYFGDGKTASTDYEHGLPEQLGTLQNQLASAGDVNASPVIRPSDPVMQTQWEPKLAPTQVVLVELLQFALAEMAIVGVKRIAVVVSAWDLVRDQYKSAEDWLKKRLPLLSQFLISNSSEHPWRIYGVSATGGDLKTKRAELLRKDRCDRIEIVGPDILNEHDITEPVRWLTS